jgi:DNA recombination protein RmuC
VDGDLPTPPPANPQLSAVSAPELVASATEQVVALDDLTSSTSAAASS